VSAVNLDEEAANLLKYQQAYQAASKTIATAQTMFNAILALFN
jgi:flagellar hook-associated protein 1 FlgK